MPELPEVETTVRGLKRTIIGLAIKDAWTDLSTKDKRQKETVADPKYFPVFKREILNQKVLSVERRAKNILINLSGGKTILIHMKMTGHLLYGEYVQHQVLDKLDKDAWRPKKPGPLEDSYNKFVHVVFSLSNGRHLVFSDARKFGKITLLDPEGKSTSYGASTKTKSSYLAHLGPEPLDKKFTLEKFKKALRPASARPKPALARRRPASARGYSGQRKIKTVLMDQAVISGIGNIYSDEILWRVGVHPERRILKIKEKEMKSMFKMLKETLKKGIDFGGDSMSDYRNISGQPGKFQLHHEAYRRTGEKCRKKGCEGIIKRKIISGRSAHFCSVHQK